jgi:RNA polymerase sigma factor (TIGR02999 family)
VPLVYDELRRAAHRERRRIGAGDTLATTALIHEAYVRLARNGGFDSHGHFLRIAAIAMRRVLVDRVRSQLRLKRGSGIADLPIEAADDFHVEEDERIEAIDEALVRLTALSPRLADIVECRFFAGYSEKETADALGLSERTVQRDWATARAWLQRELNAPL